MLATTEMQPVPPWALKPSALSSLPESWMKSVPAGDPLVGDPADVAGRVLDPDDARQLGELAHRRRRHVDDRAAGDVVDDDRQLDRVVERPVVVVEPALARLVVVGGDDERRVGADALGVAHQADRLLGVVRAGAGDHRDPAGCGLDDDLDAALVLGVGERRRLAGGADGDEPVASLGDVPLDELGQRLFVHLPVAEGGDEGGNGASEHGTSPGKSSGRDPMRNPRTPQAWEPGDCGP